MRGVLEHERQDILDWITPIDYGLKQRDLKDERQEGTGQWLLNSTEFKAWVGNDKQTLYCPGIPGAGKTFLTSIVVEELFRRFGTDGDVRIAYLYCNYKRQQEQTPENLFASLLKQFVQRQPSVPDSVTTLYNRYKNKQTRPLLGEILGVLQSVGAAYSGVFIVVDALDECQVSDNCQKIFLSCLFGLRERLGFNLFATSRPISSIAKIFEGSEMLEIRASDEDVRRYVYDHMPRLPGSVSRDLELQEEIKTAIVKVVDGIFSFAQPYLDSFAGKKSPRTIRLALRKLGTDSETIDCVYEDAMQRIYGQLEDQKRLAKQVILWITCAKRPLTTLELQHALAVEIGEPELDDDTICEAENITAVCVGLVAIDIESKKLYFAHDSMLEYFKRNQRNLFPNAEETIAAICITYISFRAFAAGFCHTDEEFEARLRSHPLYSYAARYWGHHARAVTGKFDVVSLEFLKNEAQVSSSYQALIASGQGSDRQGYSQEVQRQVTGLHLAAYFGLEQVTALLIRGVNLTCKDSKDQTPLWWAAESGSEPVMRLLSQRDRVTLPILIREGKLNLVKSIISAGYDVNSRGIWNRTLLHDAISSRNSKLADIIITAGADVNSEDGDGVTPLQMAVRLKHVDLVELLLSNAASAKDVTIEDWRSAYGKQESDTVKLLEGPGPERYVRVVQDGELQNELINLSHGHGIYRRLLLFNDDSPWEKGWINTSNVNLQRNKINIHEWTNDQNSIHSIAVWFSTVQSEESESTFKVLMDEKIRITWTMKWVGSSNGEQCCRSVDHFSTLKDVWIPDYSLQFFISLIRHLKEKWLDLCCLAQEHLTQCRRDVLDGKGEQHGLINSLLEDAQKWTEFRSYVRDQAEAARKFGVGYSHRYQEEIAFRELEAEVAEFEREINDKIDLLDKSSQGLIEIEFNLVSINEARRSTSMSASIKRLSWITFIFLPLMFVSSLFGMNVNILKNNPDWRWYFLIGGTSQIVTLIGWLSFKYIPIESWIEHKAHHIQRKMSGKLPRPDIENAVNKRENELR